jgi:type I restriction enzyme S subunit
VALGEVLATTTQPERVDATAEYQLLGVRLEGAGPFLRETKLGTELSASTLSRVYAGDFIFSRLFAWRGAFGVVPSELDGCFVSNEFPTFRPTDNRLDVGYLNLWFRLPRVLERVAADCTGSTPLTRNRYKEQFLLKLEMPLPPIEEQRRVVRRIEQLATKLTFVQRIHDHCCSEVRALRQRLMSKAFEPEGGQLRTIESVCLAVIDNLHSTPKYAGDDFPCIRSQDVGWGSISFAGALRTDEVEFVDRTRRGEPRAGDIVYVREGDVGRCGLVDGLRRFSLGQRVMMLRPDPAVIDSRFLLLQLMSPPVLEDQVLTAMTGTTSHHVNIKRLKQVRVVVPPLDEQRRTLKALDHFRTRLASLDAHLAGVSTTTTAVLPSAVSRVFAST